MDTHVQQALYEVRAQILWGAKADTLRENLRQQGFDEEQIELILSTCLSERSKEIRRRGLRDMVIGSGLLIVAIPLILLLWGFGRIAGFPIALFLYGTVSLLKGLERLLEGGNAKGSVTEM
jgi:hypothetical protein